MNRKEPKPSRKTRYTRMVLKDSLIELMKQKSILKISIKDICDLADVSRTTFYTYFDDQYELLQQIQEEILANFAELLEKYYSKRDNPANILKIIEEFLQYIADNNHSIQVLMSENGDINFQKKIFSFANYKKTLKYLPVKEISSDELREYLSVFFLTGTITLIQHWLKHDMKMPVKDLAKLIYTLTFR